MEKKTTLSFATVLILLLFSASAACAGKGKVPMAKICGNCHKAEAGIMMGFLDNISLKAKTVQMNFLSHKDIVKFNDNTTLKSVDSFEDIRNYKNKGFAIHFKEKDGEKVATSITRFDILKTIESGEYKVDKLSKEQFKQKHQAKGTVVYDVRPPMLYKASHIPGAKPLPAPAFNKFKDKLPKDKTTPLILYGVGGCLSPTVAFNLKSMGYESVSIFTDGFPSWIQTDASVTTAEWLKKAITDGIPHVLIDLHSEDNVSKGHIRGAVSIPYTSLNGKKDAFPIQKNAPIILYGPDQEKGAQTVISWGYRNVRTLPVTFELWKSAGNPVAEGATNQSITYVPKPKRGTVSIAEFDKAARGDSSVVLIDVRNPDEVTAGQIKDSINIPADQIGLRAGEIPADKEILLFCPSGIRAEMAYTTLDKKGIKSRYLDAHVSIANDGSFELKEK